MLPSDLKSRALHFLDDQLRTLIVSHQKNQRDGDLGAWCPGAHGTVTLQMPWEKRINPSVTRVTLQTAEQGRLEQGSTGVRSKDEPEANKRGNAKSCFFSTIH